MTGFSYGYYFLFQDNLHMDNQLPWWAMSISQFYLFLRIQLIVRMTKQWSYKTNHEWMINGIWFRDFVSHLFWNLRISKQQKVIWLDFNIFYSRLWLYKIPEIEALIFMKMFWTGIFPEILKHFPSWSPPKSIEPQRFYSAIKLLSFLPN